MLKYLKYLRNKYTLTLFCFAVYILFLDDVDIFKIFQQKRKHKALVEERMEVEEKLKETKSTLEKLSNPKELERFAREKKMFKKDDEDIFVITQD